MSKTNSRKISEPRSNKSLFVPTLLSIALLSAFSSSAIAANSGGEDDVFEDSWGQTSYGNHVNLTDRNVIINEGFESTVIVYGAYTDENDRVVSDNMVTASGAAVTTGYFPSSFFGGSARVINTDGNATTQTNQNTVSISDANTDSVKGGESYASTSNGDASAEANNNTVTISQSTVARVHGGNISASSNHRNVASQANGNTVAIGNSEIKAQVAGAHLNATADNGEAQAEANDNIVTISSNSTVGSTSVAENVYGAIVAASGNTVTAHTDLNTVTVTDSTITGDLFGGNVGAYGISTTANANHNTVIVTDSTITGSVFGGNVKAGGNNTSAAYANNNTLTISQATVDNGYVDGGDAFAYSPNTAKAYANSNSVTIQSDSSLVNIDIYGGYADADAEKGDALAETNNNKVDISQSTVDGYVYGGYAYAGSYNESAAVKVYANENTVSISDKASIGRDVYGGYGDATTQANENKVSISGESTKVSGDVYGGFSDAGTQSGDALAEASNNEVTISQATVDGSNGYVKGGYAYAKSSDGTATATAYANNNVVTISQSAMVNTSVYGGEAYVYAEGEGDNTAFAYANYNTVAVLDGATVKGDIYGGYADAYADAYAGKSNTEQASYNTVIIDSSTVSSNDSIVIAGGAIYADEQSDSHTATHNTVNISGPYTISSNVSLWGGYVVWYENGYGSSSTDDLFTGNTLNLDARLKDSATTVGQVANFETINLRAGEVQADGTVLETSGTTLGDYYNKDNGTGTTVNLLSVETDNLKTNDQITLISNAEGTLANNGQKQFVPVGESIALGYNGEVALDDTENKVVFNIEGKGANPKTKVLNESRAAEMAFLNSAADLLQDQDIHKAGKHVFGAVRGIYNKYKTGSSVDISGVGLVTGVANTWAGDSADLTGAVFVEAGWGSFDTKNDIMGSVQRGDGNSQYYGTGLITKFDVTQGLFSGLYAEAAAHVGIISTDYSNAGLSNLNGVTASYDTDSLYYAAHATAGYRWNMTDKFDLDLSATYLWNYLESQEVRIAADKFDFDSVQSHRMRLAAEVGYTADKGFRPYAGVAWEREFDGEAGGSVDGVRLEEADLGGDSGLAWAGVSFEPKEGGPVKADAEITTYFGQRKGVSGRIWVRYEF